MKNKTNIITGAAMGLGLAAAKELASIGANLTLVDYNEKRMEDAKHNPTRRLGLPREVAKVVAFLLSEENSYVSGQIIAIDGGESNMYGNA